MPSTQSLGFTRSTADECVYIKRTHKSTLRITIYVNNLGLFATSKSKMAKLKQDLKDNFTMMDLGEMKKILGIQVIWDQQAGTLKILQSTYIDKILMHFNMANVNPVLTPLSKNVKLEDIKAQAKDPKMPYAKAIRSLMYTAIQMRPDISFVVQHLSQYTTNPTQEHWTTVKHVLWYLKGTCDEGIVYSWTGNTPQLKIYSDTNFANRMDAKSISGYACIIDGACIVWSSKKQGTVALSTTEVEYIVLTHAAKQMTWIHCLLDEIGLEKRDPTPIHCNNLLKCHNNHTRCDISHVDKAHQHLLSFYSWKSGFKQSITHLCRIEGQHCGYHD